MWHSLENMALESIKISALEQPPCHFLPGFLVLMQLLDSFQGFPTPIRAVVSRSEWEIDMHGVIRKHKRVIVGAFQHPGIQKRAHVILYGFHITPDPLRHFLK